MALALIVLWVLMVVMSWMAVCFVRQRRKLHALGLRPLPGPRSWPLVGAAPALAKYPKPWHAFAALRKDYGDVYGFRVGSCECVVVSGLENMREVLVRRADHFAHRPDFARFEAIFRGHRDRSVALCDWSSKQRRRRAVSYPATHPRVGSVDHDRLGAVVVDELRHLIDRLPASGPQLHDTLLKTSANIFFAFLCGQRFDLDDDAFVRAVDAYQRIFVQLFDGYPLDFFPWLRAITGRRVISRIHRLSAQVSAFTHPIVDEHRATLDRSAAPRDLVDALLLDAAEDDVVAGEDERLTVDEVVVVVEDLVGGHAALHNACMWALALLSYDPRLQERLAAEAEKASAGRSMLTLADRPKLALAEATVFEVLRLVVSPVIPHRAVRDTYIQDFHVEAGSLVFFNTLDLNLDPNLWMDPLVFNPDRFLSPDGHIIKPDHFLPFGAGKRSCLGGFMSRSTLLLTIAQLTRCFEIRHTDGDPSSPPPPPPHQVPGTVLWPRNVHLHLVPRNSLGGQCDAVAG